MAVIDIIYKSEEVNGCRVDNIPWKAHDYPCEKGCCENMLTIGIGTHSKVNWMLRRYMPANGLKVFDFNNWTTELNEQWKEFITIS